jgi:antirestriction protein
MMTSTSTPRIYVASLADYNAGRLHGQWIDLDETTTADDIREAIAAMLSTSPEPIAEEWAIHDYDDMPNLGEWPDLDTVAQVARGIAEHGDAYRAWSAYDPQYHNDPDQFEDEYQGEYDTEEDFAEETVSEMYTEEELGPLGAYIDYEKYARDLFVGDFYSIPSPSGVYVFRNY